MKIPASTYRVQLNKTFALQDLERLIPYFHKAGVSHIYASPVLAAVPGSMHGYDMTDFRYINPDIGTLVQLENIAKRLHDSGMGWIQDFAPNHMAYSELNPFMLDVMANGRDSIYSDYFDILWERDNETHPGKVCAPFLGEELNASVAEGKLRARLNEELHLDYQGRYFPLSSESIEKLDSMISEAPGRELPNESTQYHGSDQAGNAPHDHRYLLSVLNSGQGFLEKAASMQNYRLEHWKNTLIEINYRRFFSINDLIALRIEDEKVFEDVHNFVLDLIRKGVIDGLRIDHIDGLLEPGKYLERLSGKTDFYKVVEKILEDDEQLPQSWDCQGTTGYDFLNALNQVFTLSKSEQKFTDNYRMISGGPGYFAGQLREVKREKLHNEFSGDLENVISEMNHAIDVPREDLKQFLSSLISRMDVYRTYISDSSGKCGESYLAKTVQDLVTEEPDLRTVGESILEELHGAKRLTALFGRFQQLSSPVMAKSLEDTMFFRYNRLISLNEVGCDPAVFGYSLPRFHEFMKSRGEAWKYSMNCTSTHDTKLGEDSRIRLSVLSEVPEEWFPVYKKWTALNARFKKEIDGKFAPDPNEEYYLYQVMLAGRYFDEDFNESFRNRISSHMIKALRESGTKTSWINGNSVYESQIELFVKKILDPEISGEFLSSFDEFLNVISKYGALKSLSQLAVKMTSPGVPDIYQGSETWNFSLTDPDNRRPVDYNELEKSLSEIERRKGDPDLASKLLSKYRDGLVKLYLTNILLIHRRNNRELFLEGSYTPLECGGDHEDNLIAFSREFRGKISITIAPRFFSGLVSSDGKIPGPESWGDTYLKIGWRASRLVDIITGRQIELGNDNRIGAGNLLNKFPVCILYGES